jgi:hypothetical protein
MRLLLLVILGIAAACTQGAALAGHDNIEVDPALKRHAGQVAALGAPDAQGRVYSFELRRLPACEPFRALARLERTVSSPAAAKVLPMPRPMTP